MSLPSYSLNSKSSSHRIPASRSQQHPWLIDKHVKHVWQTSMEKMPHHLQRPIKKLNCHTQVHVHWAWVSSTRLAASIDCPSVLEPVAAWLVSAVWIIDKRFRMNLASTSASWMSWEKGSMFFERGASYMLHSCTLSRSLWWVTERASIHAAITTVHKSAATIKKVLIISRTPAETKNATQKRHK